MGAKISNPDRFRKVGDMIPINIDTYYLAATDLVAFAVFGAGASGRLWADLSEPPNTVIGRSYSDVGSWGSAICAIVPKGNYWGFTKSNGLTASLWYRPLAIGHIE